MSVRTTRVNAAKNMARFYEIEVSPTLFGEFAVQRHWGRISLNGQSKDIWYSTEAEADRYAATLENAKLRRGYVQFGH